MPLNVQFKLFYQRIDFSFKEKALTTLTKLKGIRWLTIIFFWGGGWPPKNLPDAHLRIQKVTSSKFFHNFVFFILQDIMNKLAYSKLKAMSLDYQVLSQVLFKAVIRIL